MNPYGIIHWCHPVSWNVQLEVGSRYQENCINSCDLIVYCAQWVALGVTHGNLDHTPIVSECTSMEWVSLPACLSRSSQLIM